MVGTAIGWKNGNSDACGYMHGLPPENVRGLDIVYKAMPQNRSVVWLAGLDQR